VVLVTLCVATPVAIATASLLPVSTSSSPTQFGCPLSTSLGSCWVVYGNTTFAARDITIPVAASGWGPATEVTWQNVHFRLWPERLGAFTSYLQGTGKSPTGVVYAFVIDPEASPPAGNLSFPGPSASSWYSPDGSFGVTWESQRAGSWNVRLWAANPSPVFAVQQVVLPPPTFSVGPTTSVDLSNVRLDLRIEGWGTPAGPSLNVSATEPEGIVIPLGYVFSALEESCSLMM
jgi:hypothetical protein